MTKLDMFNKGVALLAVFCKRNQIRPPAIHSLGKGERLYELATCAFYRPEMISIMVPKCAHIGVSGMAWSCPAYKVDRTPYGVLQHELGHHVDHIMSLHFGKKFSEAIYNGCPHLSGYRGSGGEYDKTHYYDEWFAEHFRLFVTNPELHRLIAPKVTALFERYFFKAEDRDWLACLQSWPVPERTLSQVNKLLA